MTKKNKKPVQKNVLIPRHAVVMKRYGGQSRFSLEIQSFATLEERERAKLTRESNPTHVRPSSTLVAAIGTSWSPTAWQKVIDMVEYANAHGVCCWLREFSDPCTTLPYQAAGPMRDVACSAALDGGFEWLLLIENDILPEPDLLLRLQSWNMPVVVPYIKDEERDRVLAGGRHEPNQGLISVSWAVMSCVLIWTKVLNCFPNGQPFGYFTAEGDFTHKLIHYGHRMFQDTNTPLKTAKGPTYHGDCKNLAELLAFWSQADVKRKQEPNRKPIDPERKQGIYLPEYLVPLDEDITKEPPEPQKVLALTMDEKDKKT